MPPRECLQGGDACMDISTVIENPQLREQSGIGAGVLGDEATQQIAPRRRCFARKKDRKIE